MLPGVRIGSEIQMKPRFTFLGAVSLVPFAGFCLLTFFALLAYLQVGHWPLYARPDPKDVGPGSLGELMGVMVFSFVFTAPVAFVVICGFRGRREIGWRPWQWPVVLAGAVLFFIQFARLGTWLFD
jgi:hypothetical protein